MALEDAFTTHIVVIICFAMYMQVVYTFLQ